MMSPSIPVPPELTDMVVDHLHDDTQTLSSCSLVSRSWHCSARYHMFHSLSIRSPSLVEGFDKFLRFLDSSPNVWMFVKELHLLGHTLSSPYHTPEYCQLTPSILLSILSKLSSLRSLTLEGISWDGSCEAITRGNIAGKAVGVIRALDTLTLRQVRPIRDRGYPSFAPSGIQGVFQLFSSLRRLRLYDVLYFDPISSFFSAPASLPSLDLQDLTIDGACGSRYFVDSILGSQALSTLRSLRIKSSGVSDAQSFRTLLRELAPTLLHLELDLLDCTNPLFLAPQTLKTTFSTTISECTNLATFHLRISLDHAKSPTSGAFDRYRSGWPYVSTVITDLPTHLPTLTISLIAPAKPLKAPILKLIDGADWDEIRAGLERLEGLQALTFVVKPSHLSRQISENLAEIRGEVHNALSRHLSSFQTEGKLILL